MNEQSRAITASVTGASSPTAAKLILGNTVIKKAAKSLIPFLAGGCFVGVLVIAWIIPFMIQQSESKMLQVFDSKTAKLQTDVQTARLEARIAKMDAESALRTVQLVKETQR